MARHDGIDRTSVRNLAVSDKAVINTRNTFSKHADKLIIKSAGKAADFFHGDHFVTIPA